MKKYERRLSSHGTESKHPRKMRNLDYPFPDAPCDWYIYLHYAKQKSTKYRQIYCWWTKSCTSWYGEYPIVYRVLYIPGGAGFRPSTVSQKKTWIHRDENWQLTFFLFATRFTHSRRNVGLELRLDLPYRLVFLKENISPAKGCPVAR